jgi:hypothetical protein
MAQKKRKQTQTRTPFWQRITLWQYLSVGALFLLITAVFSLTTYESYASLYDADYVGKEVCAECHTIMYDRWRQSPHANMTHQPNADTVVGDFDNGSWALPP